MSRLSIEGISYVPAPHGGNVMMIRWEGEEYTLAGFSRLHGMSKTGMFQRLKKFQSIKLAVDPPRVPNRNTDEDSRAGPWLHRAWVQGDL